MTQIPNNSTVTYTADVNHTEYLGAGSISGLIEDVKKALRTQGITVISSNVPFAEAASSAVGAGFAFTMQISIENGTGFDGDVSLKNVVDDVIEAQGTGINVISSDVLDVKTLDSKGNVVTQNTSVNTNVSKGDCISGKSTDVAGNFSLSCWFGNLTGKGLSTVGLLTIVAVLGVGLFVLSGGASLGTAVTTLSRRARRAAA